jgi:hypothetical protein
MSLCIALISDKPYNLPTVLNKLQEYGPELICIIDNNSLLEYEKDDDFPVEIVFIQNEAPQEYGISLAKAFSAALSGNITQLITIDPHYSDTLTAVVPLEEELKYGYSLIKGSRILENYDYSTIDNQLIEETEIISNFLNNYIDISLTDPFSPICGYSVEGLRQVELVEESPTVHIQLLMQIYYMGLSIHEIPLGFDAGFGSELREIDLSPAEIKILVETEYHLYGKKTIN